jgi:hypothetical protein
MSDGVHRERVTVTAISATTFTVATLVNNYNAGAVLSSTFNTALGLVQVNVAGSTVTLVLYNGNPNDTLASSAIIASITTLAAGTYWYWCEAKDGLFYTLSGGTIGDYTAMILDTLSSPA